MARRVSHCAGLDSENIFNGGCYGGQTLKEVVNDYGGRGWLIEYAMCALSVEDVGIIKTALDDYYEAANAFVAWCPLCECSTRHIAALGCLDCQEAENGQATF